jgi:hypothetical protein
MTVEPLAGESHEESARSNGPAVSRNSREGGTANSRVYWKAERLPDGSLRPGRRVGDLALTGHRAPLTAFSTISRSSK